MAGVAHDDDLRTLPVHVDPRGTPWPVPSPVLRAQRAKTLHRTSRSTGPGLLTGCLVDVPGCPNCGYLDEIATSHPTNAAASHCRACREGMLSLSEFLLDSARLLLEDSAGPLMPTSGSDRCFKGRLAFDGKLRNSPPIYGRFIGDLYSKGLWEQGPSCSQVTPFFVARKDKTMRLIMDTRAANTILSEPPYTSLAGEEALASIEVPPGCKLTKAQGGVSCCFCQLFSSTMSKGCLRIAKRSARRPASVASRQIPTQR